MNQKNKLNAAIEASVLEDMMDDATHQVEFSRFCLKHYLNLDFVLLLLEDQYIKLSYFNRLI